jgi:hypothetical protein
MAEACKHNQTNVVTAAVIYLEDKGRYSLDIGVQCSDCGTRFKFLGMEMGLDPAKPMMSVGGLEAHLPIEPDPHATSMMAETVEMCTACGDPIVEDPAATAYRYEDKPPDFWHARCTPGWVKAELLAKGYKPIWEEES